MTLYTFTTPEILKGLHEDRLYEADVMRLARLVQRRQKRDSPMVKWKTVRRTWTLVFALPGIRGRY